MNKNQKRKLCFVSSSGGHYEQLKMLKPLEQKYEVVWVTEKTSYVSKANYYVSQTGRNDPLFVPKLMKDTLRALFIWMKEKPEFVVTTGALAALPFVLIAKLFRKKVIYIESFARVSNASTMGKLMYRYADLFIVQWESMLKVYPKAVYGGSIY